MVLDKKEVWAVFVFKFKMGHKTAETTHDSNNMCVLGSANKYTVQGCFRKVCKDESFEAEEWSVWALGVDKDQ